MTLTSQQISYLQAELTANDVAGFYALLDSYGDTYGRLGLGVTNNDTWQGQIANAFAESAASDNTANMQYGSQDWTSVNSQLAQEYLDLYTDNSGDQPTWQQIQSIHNDVYQNNGLDPNDWFPNKMLDDAILPGNLWQDWQENTNALDVWEDLIGIASSAGALDFAMLINGTPVLNTSPENLKFLNNLTTAVTSMDQIVAGELSEELFGHNLLPYFNGWAEAFGEFANILSQGLEEVEDWLGNVLSQFKASILAEVVPIDPLVLDLDGDGIELLSVENGVYWDLDTDGFAEAAGWVAPDDGLLALDANSDGAISTQTELFGSETQDGFSALSVLDSNSDNVIDASDSQFGDLLVWQDVNSDGISQSGEMFSLSSLGITAISLNDSNVNYTIEGHRISHESTFTINGQAQAIGEAWFLLDQANTRYDQSYDLDVRVLFLPSARGYGNLPDLHIAMSLDSDLLTQVEDIATKSLDELLDPSFDLQSTMYDMLYTWAGVDGVSPTSRGPNIDARIVEFLEEMSDDEFYSEAYGLADKTEPNADAAEILESAFFDFYREMMIKLLLQTPAGEEIFSTTGDYNPFTGDWTGSYTLDFTAIEDLFDNMALTGQGLEDAWGSVFHVINKVIGVGNLSSTDYSTLSTLVADSDPASLLDIDDVLLNTRNIFIGSSLDETFNGTEGNDFVWANGGADTFYGEGGNDFFTGGSAGSLVYGDAGNDTISSQGTVYGGEGDDIIDINNGTAYGDEGDDYIYGEGTMYGGDGDDYIEAEDDSIVYGGLGDDQIEIGANSNTQIHWTPGDGNDAIMTSAYDNDATLYIHGGMTAADLRFYSTEGYDPFLDEMTDALAIEIDGTEVITISNQLIDDRRDIETIIFDDSSTLDLTAGLIITGTSGNDNLLGTGANDTIYGLGGNDHIDGAGGDNTIYGGDGNDNLMRGIEIWGGNGNDQINVRNGGVGYGEDGDDTLTGVNATLYGGAGNDIFQVDDYDDAEIYGGTGDDEIIIGVNSSQNIYWSVGGGNDSIGTTAYDNDAVLYMQGGIKAHDLTYTQTNGYDYRTGGNSSDTLAITYGSETIKVSNHFYDSRRALDKIIFDDGTEIRMNGGASLHGTSGADTLTGVTYVGSEDDEIYGYDGNDTLNGLAGDDELHAGSGNDTLTGGDGADTYYYTSGDDVINESSSSGTTFDRLVMASGIVEGDLSYAQSGDDLVITVSGLGSITLTSFYDAAQDYQVEELEVDSTLIDLTALSFDETITGTSGDDTITGTTGDDTIDAGEGNDTINGGDGIDTVTYANATTGVTVSLDYGTSVGQGNDTLMSIENVIGSDYDDDIDGDTGDNVFVAGLGEDYIYGNSGNDVFYDITDDLGASIDTSLEDGDFSNQTYDWFSGGSGDDTFYAQAGAAWLEGGTGDDTYHVWFHADSTAGSEIYIQDSWDDNTIYFESLDYTDTNYHFTFAGDTPFHGGTGQLGALTLHYTGTSTETQILMENQYRDPVSIQTFVWADNTTKNFHDLDFVITGTSGNDSLTGSSDADYVLLYTGNDSVYTGAGNDFIGSAGGTDTIYAEAGNDDISVTGGHHTIHGGDGNDRIELGYTTITGLVYGDAGDDEITSSNGDITAYGGAGNDDIDMGGGDDVLYGGDGNDYIRGGTGNDVLSGDAGHDNLYGERGDDLYVYTSGLDKVIEVGESNGSDVDRLHLGNGIDINDISIVNQSSYDAEIIINENVDEVRLYNLRSSSASRHVEELSFDDGFVTDQLTDYQDWIWGTSGYDFTTGTSGDDVIIGKGGDDDLGGAAGDDDIHGGSGADMITGGDGADYLHGGEGNDDISGNDGLDILYGGDGADTFNFDADAFNDVDELRDFDTSESDVIDIASILDGYYDSGTDDLSDFVQFVDDGTDSLLQIDQNGGGDSFATVARLTDLTGLGADTLETNGYLVTEI